jgi:hypothetical protein
MQVKISNAAIMLLAIGLPVSATNAQDLSTEVVELRQLIIEMRDDYERRIGDLEARLDKAERDARGARRDAGEAIELAEETAINQSAGSSAPNTFNPAIGAVLNAHYADVGTGWEEIPGFQPAGEIGTGGSGFSLGEAEFNLKANIDAQFFGNITFALAEEDGEAVVEFEEAWMQTTALPAGFSITGGRFFSEAGYLNGFHFHADDFVDRPLPYQAFYGGRHAVDGVQARWLAPTSLLFERMTRHRLAHGRYSLKSVAISATAVAGNSALLTSALMRKSVPAARTASQPSPVTATLRSWTSSGSGRREVTGTFATSRSRASTSVARKTACSTVFPTTATRRVGTCRVCGSLRSCGAWACDTTLSMPTTGPPWTAPNSRRQRTAHAGRAPCSTGRRASSAGCGCNTRTTGC